MRMKRIFGASMLVLALPLAVGASEPDPDQDKRPFVLVTKTGMAYSNPATVITVTCPERYAVAGGGIQPNENVTAYWGAPTPDGRSWQVSVTAQPPTEVTAYAICQRVT